MKKGLLLFAMMLFSLSFQAKAEDWTDLQHEVSLSYGTLPVVDLLHYYENYFNPSGESVDLYDDKGKFGSLNISYLFYPDDNLGFGIVYSYTNSDKRILRNTNVVGDFYNSFHSICPSLKYNWYNYNLVTLYSRVNAGIAIATTKASFINEQTLPEEKTATKVFFMYQVSPVGIEVGRQIAGFIEVGFGHMGTAMAGLRYRM
ncbi:hypothetical protein [Parabacteroides sp. AM08-6]|uniref:hypothetical protein n=1 Tax=Parabacteroides sp. AM08-6 TaxID=2292053 RepID=UPI0011C3446B|nr:hypothetical protein [Parabacteroides sp. AM08-6]